MSDQKNKTKTKTKKVLDHMPDWEGKKENKRKEGEKNKNGQFLHHLH